MNNRLRIVLRAGERVFLNGAVIKVDRKVGIELMNDVVFLLEQHVLKPEETTTPLRQLYFMIQMMLMDPALHMKAQTMATESIATQLETFTDPRIRQGLLEVEQSVQSERPLDALKRVRALFPIEEELMKGTGRSGGCVVVEEKVA